MKTKMLTKEQIIKKIKESIKISQERRVSYARDKATELSRGEYKKEEAYEEVLKLLELLK